MRSLKSARGKNEPRIDMDIIIYILELVLQEFGAEGRSGILVVSKALNKSLARAFYASIRLTRAHQVYALCKTLLFYPGRSRGVRELWVNVGRYRHAFPITNTLQYPHHYGRSRWVGRAIMPENFGPLGHLITVTAVFIQNLTVIGRCSNSTLTELFCRLHFPNVKGLEIPASLFEVMSSVQVPALTHLRVTADMADHDPSYRFLKLQQGFTAYQSLTHLYITYGRVNGFGVTIEDQLFWIRTGSAVRAVALEVNDGDRLAYPPNELWKYDVHPKLVFIVHRDWEDVAIDPADFVWGSFELLDGEEDWRLPYVKAMVVVTDENEKDVWSAIDDCIAERWKEFEVEYTAAEKREILDAPELLLFGWRGSRMH